ncbi:hypothetical protein A2U01_0031891 [Trifolium medium]|uniref:Uncharacterized protein n=1 Tax=Trifolium medium TaxID=97028 RepID=A0A392PHL3_9FABA|nr:hypothetical protein [Trifolium medium]
MAPGARKLCVFLRFSSWRLRPGKWRLGRESRYRDAMSFKEMAPVAGSMAPRAKSLLQCSVLVFYIKGADLF